ncbi:hypothetical protein [Blastopirellula retiformator]|uniref:hypothetical protein n=1 Tax=Blastopirellula retiformator TaxID=2527970 RepID=UPI001FE7D389|nr:hypothetical protein [Blastopirellula retiformator]
MRNAIENRRRRDVPLFELESERFGPGLSKPKLSTRFLEQTFRFLARTTLTLGLTL